MNRFELERRARLWQRHRAIHTHWVSVAAGVAAASILIRSSALGAIVIGAGVLAGCWRIMWKRARPVTAETMAAHLNRLCSSLEESATLWLRDSNTLSLVERLQLRRIDAVWETLPERDTLGCPRARALRPAIASCSAAALILAGVILWPRTSATLPAALQPVARDSHPTPITSAPALRAATLEIEPPAYLGERSRRVDGLDAEVPEGSIVTWHLEFAGGVSEVSLVPVNARAQINAELAGGGRFRVRTAISETHLYQLAVTTPGGAPMLWPELHAVKALRDQAPRLAWQEPAASRTVVDPAAGSPLMEVRLSAIDDHEIDGVKLIMTVAKGSGEGVKFREQEISLDRSAPTTGGGDTFGRTLDLVALGLEPGDELYFHAIATDRRTPVPNRTRSETRFVVLRGPATELASPPVGLAGINRLPQYFRSQRQLIIDTERLLAARPTITAEAFLAQSEEIGIDQKLLRLRYGHFLGEEFEATSSGAPKEAQAMAFSGALRGQSREAMNRAGAVERAVEAQHVHPPPVDRTGRPLTVEEIIAPFVHVHDNPEAATLFDTHVKTALRAVLAAMWEAEGFLRTGQPAEALPAENRALELLKALQQADRVYVKRIGHEPAPIKIDERRLRGELEAIPKRAQGTAAVPLQSASATALATAIGSLGETASSVVPEEAANMVEAQLVAKAQEHPELYLSALELWRRRSPTLPPGDRTTLRQALWSMLPPAAEIPHRSAESAPALARRYFDTLGATAGRSQ